MYYTSDLVNSSAVSLPTERHTLANVGYSNIITSFQCTISIDIPCISTNINVNQRAAIRQPVVVMFVIYPQCYEAALSFVPFTCPWSIHCGLRRKIKFEFAFEKQFDARIARRIPVEIGFGTDLVARSILVGCKMIVLSVRCSKQQQQQEAECHDDGTASWEIR